MDYDCIVKSSNWNDNNSGHHFYGRVKPLHIYGHKLPLFTIKHQLFPVCGVLCSPLKLLPLQHNSY